MEIILLNLTDPAWWFTGMFFILVALGVKPVGKFGLKRSRSLLQGRRLKRIKKIRTLRMSLASVTYEVVRTHAYFIMFLLLCLLYMFWYTASPLSAIAKDSPIAAMVLSLPIYIAEIAWLLKDSFSKDLIKEHNKALKYARKKRAPLSFTL